MSKTQTWVKELPTYKITIEEISPADLSHRDKLLGKPRTYRETVFKVYTKKYLVSEIAQLVLGVSQ